MSEYLRQLIKDFKSRDFKNFAGYVYTTLQREIDAATNNKQKNNELLFTTFLSHHLINNQ